MQFLLLIRRLSWTPSALLRTIMLVGFCLAPSAPAICSPTAVESASAASIPEPVYWKQNVFLIPYQFSSAAEPGAAQAVWLFVSKDRGATWQKISEAKPHVKSFNYRAEGDGEYWFAIRTLDHHGRAWPTGPYQPELRVIVDTTMPRIEALQSGIRTDGAIDIRWHGSDTNLDAATWRIEAQLDTNSPWQPVSTEGASSEGRAAASPNTYAAPLGPNFGSLISYSAGETTWQPPSGQHGNLLRSGRNGAAQ
jgi:hypothetical protein